MANNMNNITIVGNITRDPELRYTPNGVAQARLGVAVNRSWRDKASGDWQEATSFFDVVVWQDQAENVGNSLKKGARVMVSGRLEQRTYETKEHEKRYVFEIVAEEIGPSLRFATASVEKVERKGPDGGGGGGGGGGGDGGGGGGYSRPVPNEPTAPATDYGDFGDDPF